MFDSNEAEWKKKTDEHRRKDQQPTEEEIAQQRKRSEEYREQQRQEEEKLAYETSCKELGRLMQVVKEYQHDLEGCKAKTTECERNISGVQATVDAMLAEGFIPPVPSAPKVVEQPKLAPVIPKVDVAP